MKYRIATLVDCPALYDMDLKIFDEVWPAESWNDWFADDRYVFIAEVNGHCVGFAVCTVLSDGIFIEKIGVKHLYRGNGISRQLLKMARDYANLQDFPNIVVAVFPETFFSPGKPGDITGWIKRVKFKAETPFHPNYFCINGEHIDGIPCVLER
jgi:GNAT superfamily N-acetyltransferase